MFQATSDVSATRAHDLVTRDAKEYQAGGQRSLAVAQVETVGPALRDRTRELLDELEAERAARGHALMALMVTDILAKGTKLLVAGDLAPVERAFGLDADGGVLDLPGVMSRKKQVVPPLLAAL
jgi:manganese-dependent inorganic pyrophosphatase